MKKLVIFDLDGTLLYTLEDLADSVNYVLDKFAYPLCTIQQIRTFVGNGVSRLLERAIGVDVNKSCANFDEMLVTLKSHYKGNMYNKTCPYDGVIEMLSLLKKEGVKIAVVSNKFDKAVKELCAHYFEDLIDTAIGESELIPPKPSPDGVLKSINDFGFELSECVYVGDSDVDIQTAERAKIQCIVVDWGYKDKDFLIQNGAVCIVSDCQSLYEKILEQ